MSGTWVNNLTFPYIIRTISHLSIESTQNECNDMPEICHDSPTLPPQPFSTISYSVLQPIMTATSAYTGKLLSHLQGYPRWSDQGIDAHPRHLYMYSNSSNVGLLTEETCTVSIQHSNEWFVGLDPKLGPRAQQSNTMGSGVSSIWG